MKIFLFILKSVGLSVVSSFIIGAILGLIMSFFKPEHPHQIIPTWLIFGILLFAVNLAFSLITSIIMIAIDKLKIEYVLAISIPASLIGIIIYWISIK